MSVLLEFLTTLSDKGLILFLRNEKGQSWVIINIDVLLSKINGVLFAPAEMKHVYRDMASNTGIVPLSALKEAFPDHDTDMLVGFLISLQFCHMIESNISAPIPLPLDELLFFPALISTERPTNIKIENGLGWCLWCPDPNEFLSTRFLHGLLLWLAYTYCLDPGSKPGKINETNPVLQKLVCPCTVWTMVYIGKIYLKLSLKYMNTIVVLQYLHQTKKWTKVTKFLTQSLRKSGVLRTSFVHVQVMNI